MYKRQEVERRQLYVALPFIPCQARLVVLLAFASAYFAGEPALAVGAVAVAYLASVLLFAASSLLVRRAYRVAEPPELLMELPPIHLPSLRVLWWISWDYAKHYLRRAGFIIFSVSLLLTALTRLGPGGFVESPGESLAFAAGRALAPLMAPLGLAGERAAILAFAMLAGLLAKEVVVLSVAAATGSADPLEALASLSLSRGQALALMVFFSTYMPCAATAATIYRETGSGRLTALAVAWSLASSLLLTYLTYAILALLGLA